MFAAFAKATRIFQQKVLMYLPYFRIEILMSHQVTTSLSFEQLGPGFIDPRRVQQHSFVEIDCEIFTTAIPSFLLVQEGQTSVSGERMCTRTG